MLLTAGMYVARVFGEASFVRFSIALSTILLTGSVLGATLTTTIVRFTSFADRESDESRNAARGSLLLLAVLLALLLSAALVVAAPALVAIFKFRTEDAQLFVLGAFATFAVIVHGATMGFLSVARRFPLAAAVNLIAGVSYVALLALSPLPAEQSALVAIAVYYAFAALLALSSRSVPGWRAAASAVATPAWQLVRRATAFSIPLLIATGLAAPVAWLANLVLVRLGGGHVEVAVFNAAYTWFAVACYPAAVLAQVEFVHLSQRIADGEGGSLPAAINRFLWGNVAVMVPLLLVVGLAAPQLVALFEVDADSGGFTLRLMLVGALLMSIGDPARLFLSAIGRVWAACALNAAWGAVVLLLAVAMAGAGSAGVGSAYLVGYGVYCVVGHVLLARWVRRERPAAVR